MVNVMLKTKVVSLIMCACHVVGRIFGIYTYNHAYTILHFMQKTDRWKHTNSVTLYQNLNTPFIKDFHDKKNSFFFFCYFCFPQIGKRNTLDREVFLFLFLTRIL